MAKSRNEERHDLRVCASANPPPRSSEKASLPRPLFGKLTIQYSVMAEEFEERLVLGLTKPKMQ